MHMDLLVEGLSAVNYLFHSFIKIHGGPESNVD